MSSKFYPKSSGLSLLVVAAAVICGAVPVASEQSASVTGTAQQAPPTDRVTPNISEVVAGGTKIEVVKYGLPGTDGPVSLPDGSVILSALGGVIKVDKDGNTSTLVKDSGYSRGLALDSKGRVIAAEQKTRQVGVVYPKGSEMVLADNYDGQPLIEPNDLVVNKKGGVYFSVRPVSPLAVYYIPPGGKAIKVADGIEGPDGVTLSTDEGILYVNNKAGEYLLAYDVQPDGTLRNRRNFAKYEGVKRTENGMDSGADGLTIDSKGRLYATTAIGVQVFSSQGQHLGTIPIPLDPPAQNLGFAGPDKKDLYVVGRGVVFKIHMLAQGYKGRAK